MYVKYLFKLALKESEVKKVKKIIFYQSLSISEHNLTQVKLWKILLNFGVEVSPIPDSRHSLVNGVSGLLDQWFNGNDISFPSRKFTWNTFVRMISSCFPPYS